MEGEKLLNPVATNLGVINWWMPQWVENMIRNRPLIEHDIKDKKQRYGTLATACLSTMEKRPGTPAIICGAGPSLDGGIEALKRFKGIIIAAMSITPNLISNGIFPDIAIALDANKEVGQQVDRGFAHVDLELYKDKTWLVTHPLIHPSVLKKWKGKRAYFRPMQIGDTFFERTMIHAYPWLEIAFLNAGCVSNTALEIADFLGCNPIGFLGVDYAYVGSRCRAARIAWEDFGEGKGTWTRQPDEPVRTKHLLRWISEPINVYTSEEMLSYKQNFMLINRVDHAQVISLSKGSLVYEPPYCSPEEFVSMTSEELLKKFGLPVEAIIKRADTSLNKLGMKVSVEEASGRVKVELLDPPKPGDVDIIPSTQVKKGVTYKLAAPPPITSIVPPNAPTPSSVPGPVPNKEGIIYVTHRDNLRKTIHREKKS